MQNQEANDSFETTSEPSGLPSLAEIQRDPAVLGRLSTEVIVTLRRQVSHLAVDLDAAFYHALARTRTPDPSRETTTDRLLTPEAAAVRFGVSKRWLLDHAHQLAGVRRLSRKVIRFSERHLERFFNRTPV
jgi:hypothetical protein